MTLVLAFGLVLLVSVALSSLAARTVLSTALLVLLAGALLGQGGFGLVAIPSDSAFVSALADVALFTVLFTDGQRAGLPALRDGWRTSGKALGIGMPLTMVGIALPAHYLAGLDWPTAFLLGAVLSPTDPVFAAAIVGREDVPTRLRRLLNVESGLNDGLALPFVLIFLAAASHQTAHPAEIALELVLGLVIGISVPALVALALRLPVLGAEPRLQALGPLSVGIVVYAAADLAHANPYLAAFAAGSATATLTPRAAERFEHFGELLSETTKFAALLVFGALITPERLSHLSVGDWLVPVIALLLVRPLSMVVSLLRSKLTRRERAAAAWFGPKGFASVVYGLLVLQSGLAEAAHVFDLVAVTTALSIVLHSSSDVPIAKALRMQPPDDLPAGPSSPPDRPGSEDDHRPGTAPGG